jgi:hypothetical protein
LDRKNTTFGTILSSDPVSFKLFKFADVVCYGGVDQIIEISGAGDNCIENHKYSGCRVRHNSEMG